MIEQLFHAALLGAICVFVATLGVYVVAFVCLCVHASIGLLWSLVSGEFFE